MGKGPWSVIWENGIDQCYGKRALVCNMEKRPWSVLWVKGLG